MTLQTRRPPDFPDGYYPTFASVGTTNDPYICPNCGSLSYTLTRFSHNDYPEKSDMMGCSICLMQWYKNRPNLQEALLKSTPTDLESVFGLQYFLSHESDETISDPQPGDDDGAN